jgi:hypothetical protein
MFGLSNKIKKLQPEAKKIIKILAVVFGVLITIFAIFRFSPYKDLDSF